MWKTRQSCTMLVRHHDCILPHKREPQTNITSCGSGVVAVSLERPHAKNALGRTLLEQLEEAIASIQRDDHVRAVILQSKVPKVFCAGADLKVTPCFVLFVCASGSVHSVRCFLGKLSGACGGEHQSLLHKLLSLIMSMLMMTHSFVKTLPRANTAFHCLIVRERRAQN